MEELMYNSSLNSLQRLNVWELKAHLPRVILLHLGPSDHMVNMSVHHPDNVSVFEMILFFIPSETKVRYAFIVKNDLMTRVCQ